MKFLVKTKNGFVLYLKNMKYFLFILFPFCLLAQNTSIELNSDLHNLLERQEILGNSNLHAALNDFSSRTAFLEIKNQYDSLKNIDQYLASKLLLKFPEYWDVIIKSDTIRNQKEFIDSSQTFYSISNSTSNENLVQLISPKKGVLKYFYKNPAYFAQISTDGFLFKINPIIYFGVGKDFENNSTTFNNSRGIALSGQINDKIYFYSDILESQAAFPSFVNNFIKEFNALPGNGLYKNYNSSILGKNAGYDYLNAKAYINAKITKNIGAEFGNGSNFIGNGIRSLLLSDFSNNYLYLKFNTNIWKIHYQNLFSELIPVSVIDNPGNSLIPRKYNATHFLNFKHKNIEIGLFESVIFERENGFDIQYLNPVILYRLVEYNLDSSDNILVGLNGKWNIYKKFQVYGQLLLDEFLLKELIIERNGWWGNKYGFQIGGKYINAFNIDHLDLNIEFNKVRPYTYGHRSYANYAHANQSLAHPLGANFKEFIFNVEYYMNKKIRINSRNYIIHQGLDNDENYYGANILKPSSERIDQYGIFFLQGEASQTILSANKISYEIYHNYFIDANLLYRQQISDIESLNFKTFILSLGLRINFWEQNVHI